jgi:hypothetical protein
MVNYYLEAADGERTLLYRAGIYVQDEIRAKNFAFYLTYIAKKIFL